MDTIWTPLFRSAIGGYNVPLNERISRRFKELETEMSQTRLDSVMPLDSRGAFDD
jgi:hypothetical protein